jgi:hypothetical protein
LRDEATPPCSSRKARTLSWSKVSASSACLRLLSPPPAAAAGERYGLESAGAAAPAPEGGVLPTVRGRAWITGEGTLVLDPSDPYRHGIVPSTVR